MNEQSNLPHKTRKHKIHDIVFEADTPIGKFFDISLLILILASVLVVCLESVESLRVHHQSTFNTLEWIFTILFTLEYIIRIWVVKKPWKYISSTFGVIDLLAILPTYLSLLFAGTHYLIAIRYFRLLRIFRILKLSHYIKESQLIIDSLKRSRAKILVFLYFVIILVVIIGSVMYVIEGDKSINPDLNSIPEGIYWAIVTLTTVGFGDITPETNLGKFFSAIVMILGYAVIAVPTGIVTSEIIKSKKSQKNTQVCIECHKDDHQDGAIYCSNCGHLL